MRNTTLQFDWSIVEDEQVWQALSPAPNPGELATTRPILPRAGYAEQRLAALIVLMALLVAGGWKWQRQSSQTVLAGQLHAVVAQDIGAQQKVETGDLQPHRLLSSSVGPAIPLDHHGVGAVHLSTRLSLPDVQVEDYEMAGGRIMARVTVFYPGEDGQAQSYRETRFYSQTADQWQRIEPDAALLGPWQTLRTAHFTFRHRAIDGAAVAEIAPRLDQLYERLRRDMGLPPAVASQAIFVEVGGAIRADPFTLTGHTIAAPSPALLTTPVGMTAAGVLYQALVHPLAALVVGEVIAQHHPDWGNGVAHWWPLLDALPLWVVWEDEGPLAMSRQEVLRWLVHNAQAPTPSARQVVPDRYERLCRSFGSWNLSPAEMSIPLNCTEADQGRTWSMIPALPLRLDAIIQERPYPDDSPQSSISGSQIVALEMVVEYVVATYGQAALARLIASLGDHADWHSLIPAVFGISADAFEAGWLMYVATQAGVGDPA